VNFGVVRLLLRFLRPFWWALPIITVLGLAASFAEGIGIGLLIPLLELLMGGAVPQISFPLFQTASEYLYSLGDVARVLVVGGGILALLVVKAILVAATVSLSGWIDGRIGDDIRCRLFSQALSVDYAILDESQQGRLISAFNNQIYRVMDVINSFFLIIVHACRIAVFGSLMIFISWQLTAMVVVLGLAANLLVARPMIRFVHRLGELEVGVRSEISQQVLSSLGGMRVIRAFGQEDREHARFRKISEQARTLIFRIIQAQQIIPVALEVVYAPVFLAVVLTASVATIGVPTLLAYLLLFYRVQPDLKQLDYQRANLAGLSGSLLEVTALLERSCKSAIRSGSVLFEHLQDRITFDKVSFRYQSPSERAVTLTEVSFELHAGKTTAIVGESGAGKTTLINLLFGFYQPTEGQIRVDGRPLASLRTDLWRGKLGLAGQDVGLLEGTIRENIAYGCPHAASDEIEEAARLAAIHDVIKKLPRGYETNVGESGLQFSQGQRQRIGLARALLRRPEILILDEATNALDGLTEQVIHETLDRFVGKMTVIIIAHRLNTVRLADQVIVLNEGRVAETGTFRELMAKRGAFAKLFATQVDNADSLSSLNK